MNDSMNKEGNLNPFFINYNFMREDWKKIAEDLKIENFSTDQILWQIVVKKLRHKTRISNSQFWGTNWYKKR